MNPATVILACIAVPVVGALLVTLTGRWPNLRESMTLLSAATLFALVLSLFRGVAGGARPEALVAEMMPDLSIAFAVEPLGMLFALVASFLWVVTSVYSIGYMRGHHEANQTRFYACFALALASTMGVAFAGNLLTLFIFYEALTLSTYPLVIHAGTDEARRAGRLYLGLLLGTSIAFLLVAIIWTGQLSGTLAFTPGGILGDDVPDVVVGILLALYAFGIAKAALMPVHRWLPAAMVAPTPVSALLHAVAVVKAGVFAMLKIIVYVFGIDLLGRTAGATWLPYVAGFTIVAASAIALRQDDLKKRLAYSTISQLAYVVMAGAVLAPLSVIGAALHVVAHAFGKITLFFAAGAIQVASHKTRVSQLAGIGRRMPWTMAAFAIAALSMIGLPPTVGFVSKWYILQGAFQAERMFPVAVILVSTLLNAGYFLPIVYSAFFRPHAAQGAGASQVRHAARNTARAEGQHGEAPPTMVAALMVTAAGTVLLFLFPDAPLALAAGLVGGTP